MAQASEVDLLLNSWRNEKCSPTEVGQTAWEERSDEPADIVKHLFVVDPEGGEALGGVEGPP